MPIDHTLMVLREIRDELHAMRRRMDAEFSELTDRLRRIDERLDGFIIRIERLEEINPRG
jgi:hypothetical protein